MDDGGEKKSGTAGAPQESARPPGSETLGPSARASSGWWRRATLALCALGAVAIATGHSAQYSRFIGPAFLGVVLLMLARGLLGGRHRLGRRSFRDPAQARIGLGASIAEGATVMPGATVQMGASIGRDAVIEPGAVVEMGASIGRGAIIRSDAVVRMGATVGAGAVIESGALVSWGADVKRGARVLAGARIGAGATVGRDAEVPRDTWVMPGGEWRGGAGNRDVRLSEGPAQEVAAARAPVQGEVAAALPRKETPAVDPREIKLDAVFTRIEEELKLASPAVHQQLAPRLIGVRELRGTCASLLERERGLRAEAAPDALARLDQERSSLADRVASADDEQVRLSLASAVAAIDEQKRQRQLLARSADRLEAEQTRLFWTLDALAAQLLRMRSAGADLAQSGNAELGRSLEQLQGEIDAIANALEQVAQDERRPASNEALAPQLSEPPPASSEEIAARPESERTRG